MVAKGDCIVMAACRIVPRDLKSRGTGVTETKNYALKVRFPRLAEKLFFEINFNYGRSIS
jgi:hypothetical protein